MRQFWVKCEVAAWLTPIGDVNAYLARCVGGRREGLMRDEFSAAVEDGEHWTLSGDLLEVWLHIPVTVARVCFI